MLRSSTTSYYNADGLGSITSLANCAGALAQTYGYDSFGKQTSSSGSLTNPFQYAARESDTETGLYYYRARYYDASAGRFISEDPTGFLAGGNFYRYVSNSPLDLTDPSGLCEYKKPCNPSGWAPDPSSYSARGKSANWIQNDINLFEFHHGGSLDAQAQGGSTAYANYVFGVYMAAAGYSLSDTLYAANSYAAGFSHYGKNVPMDPKYPSTPSINIVNITKGYNDQQDGDLCSTSPLF